jgi:hypothetical protein
VKLADILLLVTYLSSGGQVGDTLKAIVTCDKCERAPSSGDIEATDLIIHSWKNVGIHVNSVYQ